MAASPAAECSTSFACVAWRVVAEVRRGAGGGGCAADGGGLSALGFGRIGGPSTAASSSSVDVDPVGPEGDANGSGAVPAGGGSAARAAGGAGRTSRAARQASEALFMGR